jgi:hypothetical protein
MNKIEHSLELEDSIDLHKRGWVIQRFFWAFFILFLLAAALGLFGNGLMSKVEVKAGNSTIEYERFGRYSNLMNIKFYGPDSGISEISFPLEYMNHFKIEKVFPKPESETQKDGRLIYRFDKDNSYKINVELKPEEYGFINNNIRVNKGTVQIVHIIYP